MSSYVVESATKFKFYALGEVEAKGGARKWEGPCPTLFAKTTSSKLQEIVLGGGGANSSGAHKHTRNFKT